MNIESPMYINSSNEIDADKAIDMGIFPCKVFCDGVEVENVISFNIIDGYLKAHISHEGGLLVDSKEGCVLTNYLFGEISYKKVVDEH